MNIFSALNYGKGNINEENISSFLGYLLNPQENHEFKTEFLKEFIKILECNSGENVGKLNLERAKMNYEYPVEYEKHKRNIDIVIELDNQIIAIENKILKGAINIDQLKEEYLGLCAERKRKRKSKNKNKRIHFVFLTPKDIRDEQNAYYDNIATSAFEKLKEAKKSKGAKKSNRNDKMYWITWDILRGLHNIRNIDEYLQITIENFINFIEEYKVSVKFEQDNETYRLLYNKCSNRYPLEKLNKKNQKFEILPTGKPRSILKKQVNDLEENGKINKKEHQWNNITLGAILINYYKNKNKK